MNKKQGHYFNRMWYEKADFQKIEQHEDYIPAHEREGYDESKVIKLDYKGDMIDEE